MIYLWLIPAVISLVLLLALDAMSIIHDRKVMARGVRVGDALFVIVVHVSAFIPVVNWVTMCIGAGIIYDKLNIAGKMQKILDYRIGGKPKAEQG